MNLLRNRNWAWGPISLMIGFVPFTIPNVVVNTFYTIIGIVFGIGFSLFIASSYKSVERDDYRELMHKNLHNIRDRFVFYFIVSTIFYLLFSILNRGNIIKLLDSSTLTLECSKKDLLYWCVNHFHLSTTTLSILCYTLFTYIKSYSSLQQLNEEMDV